MSEHITRRALLKTCAAAAVGLCLSRPSTGAWGALPDAPVVIIGAGIAGLAAARELSAQGWPVVVLEARDRLGGRIWTDRSLGTPFDLGATWIRGQTGNPLTPLLQSVGARTVPTNVESLSLFDGEGWEVGDSRRERAAVAYRRLVGDLEPAAEGLARDVSVAEAITRIDPSLLRDPLLRFHLTTGLELETGASINRLSALHLPERRQFHGKSVLFPDGFDVLIRHLARGLAVRTDHVVTGIAYGDGRVTVTTSNGPVEGRCALITLPLGVLKRGGVTFSPPLPSEKLDAIERVRVGIIDKVVLQYERAFWPAETQFVGITGKDAGPPTYCLNASRAGLGPALVAFWCGDAGLEHERHSDQDIRQQLDETLKALFGSKTPSPSRALVTRWASDPYALGATSYAGVGTLPDDFDALSAPIGTSLFFAGEHTTRDYRGTVHGAYQTGLWEAERIMTSVAGAHS